MDPTFIESKREGVGERQVPAPQATDDETRLCPLQLLRYADVDVLVGQTGEPGEARHGCEADLSATVLKRAHLQQFR